MPREPALHRGRPVRRVVVQHQMYGRPFRLGHLDHRVDRVQDLDELLMPMPAMALTHDDARLDHQGREQTTGAVAFVLVRPALGLPRSIGSSR